MWYPVSAVERFAEAISLVPLGHAPITPGQRALALGQPAFPLLEAAAHYPTFSDLVCVGQIPQIKDKRIRAVGSVAELPDGWKADLISVAIPGAQEVPIATAAGKLSAGGVVVIACDKFTAAPQVRDLCRQHWRAVTIYRDFLPEPSAFVMASNREIKRTRSIPGWARHLSDQYLPNLFRMAKDEYAFLYTTTRPSP